MSRQYSDTVRNAKRNAVETAIGTAPLLRLRTGTKPANCAAARSGTILCTITLPSDWQAASSGGATVKAGTWSSTGIGGGGNVGHYEIMDSAGTNCHEQGSVTVTGGGGDMTLDNITVADGQTITVSTYSITEGNP